MIDGARAGVRLRGDGDEGLATAAVGHQMRGAS